MGSAGARAGAGSTRRRRRRRSGRGGRRRRSVDSPWAAAPPPPALADDGLGAIGPLLAPFHRRGRAAHAGEVRQPAEPEHDRDDEQPDARLLVDRGDRDGEEGADDPGELEAGLEAGESATPHCVGRVALQEAVERDPAERGTEADDEAGREQPEPAVGAREQEADDRRGEDRPGEDDLLACELPELGRDEVAEEVADRAAGDHQTEEPGRLAGVAQREREEEGEEADPTAQQRHRAPGEDDARRVQLLLLRLVERLVDLLRLRDLPREGGRDDEHDGREPERPRRVVTRELVDDDRRRTTDEAGNDADEREPGVGVDELLAVLHHRRHQRALGDGVRLRHHEHAERQREDEEPLGRRAVDRAGHEEAQDGPAGAGDEHHDPAPALGAVEQRPQQRRHHGERGHRDDQVEQDLRPRRRQRRGEEERAGQRDREADVAAQAGGVRDREPGERRGTTEARIRGHCHRQSTGGDARSRSARRLHLSFAFRTRAGQLTSVRSSCSPPLRWPSVVRDRRPPPERTCPRSPPARRPAPPGQAAEDVRRSPGPSRTGRAGRSSGQRGTAPTRAIGPEGTIGSATTMTQMARVEAPIERTTTPPAPATGGPDDVAEVQPAESRYLNRELSWLDFNARVLALAEDPATPLLERAKFLAIFSSNLDEFFQVRVSGLQEQVEAGIRSSSPDGLEPARAAPGDRGAGCDQLVERQAATFTRGRRARRCEEAGIRFCDWDDLDRRRPDPPRGGLRGARLPGPHAARGRPGAPVPLHLEPVAEPRRPACATPPPATRASPG